jgi:hypothetical protein
LSSEIALEIAAILGTMDARAMDNGHWAPSPGSKYGYDGQVPPGKGLAQAESGINRSNPAQEKGESILVRAQHKGSTNCKIQIEV